MLENAFLCKGTTGDIKEKMRSLREELSSLQLKIRDSKLPVIILFEGWGASGKGSMIAEVIKYLDPRFFKVYSTEKAADTEGRYPWMKRFWDNIPEYGKMSVLDRSWYQELALSYIEGDISKDEYKGRIMSANTFERQLSDDGYLIIKFFLQISKKEQKKRFEKLEDRSSTSWRVTEKDWKRNKHYNEYYEEFDSMLEKTDTSYAPWNVIDAEDKTMAKYAVFSIITEKINTALERGTGSGVVPLNFRLMPVPELTDVKLAGKVVPEDEYDERIKAAQKELSKLHNKLYKAKIPLILCFEGWDAAGKGGAIKRTASALDPRGYEAIPIAAPDKTELNHHYLWRFWNRLPKSGHVAIFDRTWYGRVMVEKLEGFTSEERCEQAYNEINEFEYELALSGAVILKFWLQIDKDEQLRRFNDRQNTPEKQWKITDEDWRNREKWDLYEEAVDEMTRRTSTLFAPWTIVEANDKKFARLKVINTVIDAIRQRLD